MKINNIVIRFSFLGSILLLVAYSLGLVLFSIAGLFVPVFYALTLVLAMYYYSNCRETNYKSLLILGFAISTGMTFLWVLFALIFGIWSGNITDSLLSIVSLLLISLFMSAILALLFKKKREHD